MKFFNLMDGFVSPKLTTFVCFVLVFCLANGKLLFCIVLELIYWLFLFGAPNLVELVIG